MSTAGTMYDLDIEEILEADPDSLPYFVTDMATGGIVRVAFEPLVEADREELEGQDWFGLGSDIVSVYKDAWPGYIGLDSTYKLVVASDRRAVVLRGTQRIQGIVRIGIVRRPGGFLIESLLETAPINRHGCLQRRYSGVGAVLVARLVVDSYLQGGRGKVEVISRHRAIRFYDALGFRCVMPPDRFSLSEAGASAVFRTATVGSIELM